MTKKLIKLLFMLFIMSSCTLNKKNDVIYPSKTMKSIKKIKIQCKPQLEILVNGKCIKRRGFM
tara:strand:+ start:1486 stop:1674 length:189 start_codon:yes stop_codon:yes gene_type:complete